MLAAFLSGGLRGGAGEVGQPGKIAFLKQQRIRFFVRQHVLPELRAKTRELFVDRRQTILRRLVERAAGPHEAGVVAVEHARLLGIEPERPARA